MYAAPEVFSGIVGKAADIYSLGERLRVYHIIYLLLTQFVPCVLVSDAFFSLCESQLQSNLFISYFACDMMPSL